MPIPIASEIGHDRHVPDVSPLVGAEVRRVQLDYQVTLLLVDGPYKAERVNAVLIMETPFQLVIGTHTYRVDPSRKETHPPVCGLLHTAVTEAVVSHDQVLDLSFNDGSSLSVGPHAKYESWHLQGDGIPQILVRPQ